MAEKKIIKKTLKTKQPKKSPQEEYEEQRLEAINRGNFPDYIKKAYIGTPDIKQFDDLFGDLLTSWLVYRISIKRDRYLRKSCAGCN